MLRLCCLYIFCIVVFEQSIAQAPISAKVSMYNGRPTVFINDKPEYPMFYSLTDVPGGRWTWEEVPRYNLKSFCNIGVKLIQIDLAFDHIWKSDGTLVLDTVQRQLRGVLDVCPEAAIFIRFHVNPPKWWQKKFPGENTVYADTDPMPDTPGLQRIIEDDEENPTRHSLASERWKEDATQKLQEFLSRLKEVPESNALAGIQVAGGVYGEWHYWGFIENEPDMSEPMRKYFQAWLTAKYKTDKALKQAWADEKVTLSTARIPTLEQRRETMGGIFRHPVKERHVIDYYTAQHDLVANDILHFCRIVKENWPRPIITGAFYGYFYAVFGREAAGGHLALQRVLNSPYIDYLSGPGTYYPNAVEMGEPYRSRSLINSVTLHGKLWLDEMDQQTPLLPLKNPAYQEGVTKSIAQVRRNVLFTFSKGQGLWFYDFGPAGFNGGPRLQDHGTWGWWDEPALKNDISKLKIVLDRQMDKTYSTNADLLLVHDTESFYHMGSSRQHSGIAHRANNWLPVSIFKSGVAHDVIHLDDLGKINLKQYKAIVFANTFVLTREQKKFIADHVAKNNRHLIWIYAPGYSDGKNLNKLFVEEVTGMKVNQLNPTDPVTIVIDSTITKNSFSLGSTNITTPLFGIQDEKATSVATIKGYSISGLARKLLKESTSWFMSLPIDDVNVWRYILGTANVHTYTGSEAIIYQGNGTITVHTKQGGAITIAMKNGRTVQYDFPANATWLLDDTTGEILFR